MTISKLEASNLAVDYANFVRLDMLNDGVEEVAMRCNMLYCSQRDTGVFLASEENLIYWMEKSETWKNAHI